MATVLNTFFKPDYREFIFIPLRERASSLVRPLQTCTIPDWDGDEIKASSDFLSYALRPVIDLFMMPIFLLDTVANLINCFVSLLKTAFMWTTLQKYKGDKKNDNGIDSAIMEEWGDTTFYFYNAIASLASAGINPLLSIISLLTRPLASIQESMSLSR